MDDMPSEMCQQRGKAGDLAMLPNVTPDFQEVALWGPRPEPVKLATLSAFNDLKVYSEAV